MHVFPSKGRRRCTPIPRGSGTRCTSCSGLWSPKSPGHGQRTRPECLRRTSCLYKDRKIRMKDRKQRNNVKRRRRSTTKLGGMIVSVGTTPIETILINPRHKTMGGSNTCKPTTRNRSKNINGVAVPSHYAFPLKDPTHIVVASLLLGASDTNRNDAGSFGYQELLAPSRNGLQPKSNGLHQGASSYW